MGHRVESKPADQRFRSLLASTFSGKGILVQAVTYQFALPAIANVPLPEIVPDPITLDTDASQHDVLPAETEIPATQFSPVATQISQPAANHSVPASQLSLESEGPAVTIVPLAALAEPPQKSALAKPFPRKIAPLPPSSLEQPHFETIPPAENFQPPVISDAYTEITYIPSTDSESLELSEELSEPEEATELDAEEFSWFSIGGLTEKEKPQKLAFVTQFEVPVTPEEEALPVLIAGPQDLNPGLNNPSAPDQEPDNSPEFNDPLFDNSPAEPAFSPDNGLPPAESAPAENIPVEPFVEPADEERKAFIQWNELDIETSSDFNNFGESSWSVLPTLSGQLANGNQIGITSGFSQFEQTDFESVSHIPLTLSWQGDINDVKLQASGGVDFFNRLPTDTHASATLTTPIGQDSFVSVSVEQGPYLANAQTLENEISRWHYGPELYWQISPELSLFSKVRLGNYSDGNWEQQSFSRLERKIGETASVALNFTNQSFQRSVENTSGYFSPRDFLVATAELAWQEQIADELSCGLLGSVGQQRLAGEWALAYSGQALCTVDIGSALQIDLGYQFSNVSNDQSALVDDSAYSNQQIIGGIRVRF